MAYPKRGNDVMRKILIMSLLMILVLSLVPNSLALTSSEQDAIMTGDVEQSRAGISTYVTGAWNMTYSTLRALVGGDMYMNYGNFCRVIEEYFIPLNQRVVGLFIGWEQHANTPTTDIPYYAWVDNWLSACDQYGIANFFYFGQWGTSSSAPSWWNDVLETYPDMQTYDRNGLPVALGEANPISIDHPQLVEQYKEDLKQLWQYYGEHSSWIGWGSFPGDFAHYARTDSRVGDVGFANYSIANFAKTTYYLRDVNASGFHSDGTKCEIWESFVEYTPLTIFGCGTRQESDELDVYGGTGTGGRLVAMKFKAPESMVGFEIKWYGTKIGQPPGPLILELYEDQNDMPYNIGKPIESVIQETEKIGVSADWQPSVSFGSELIKDKYYWIVFQTERGDNSTKYEVYSRIFKTDESTCKASIDGYFPTKWNFEGSAILWIRNRSGVDKKIYPKQSIGILVNSGANLNQPFTLTEDRTVNVIFLYVSDKAYDDIPSTVQIIRDEDGVVLASGLLGSKSASGLWRWIPVILDKRIELRAGLQYIIRLCRTWATPWQWHQLITDPSTQGFQGQYRTFLFKLADMDLSILQNFIRCNYPTGTGSEIGDPGVTDTNWYSVRFKPKIDAPLSIVDVKIYRKYGTPADFKITLRADYDGNGARPGDIDLESKIIPATDMPATGWVNTTGWTTPLKADSWYWIIFSTVAPATSSGYRICQTVNPIEYMLLLTRDSGFSWERPREIGELIFKAATSVEVFKVEPENAQFGADETKITDQALTAQSFSLTSNIVVKGVLVYIIRGPSDPGGDLIVELRDDSGMDYPSMMPLTSGNLSLKSVTGEGVHYVDFKFPITLSANKTYWIVLKSTEDATVFAPYYMYREPKDSFGGIEYKAKRSTDGGTSWHLPAGTEADIIFSIVQPMTLDDYRFRKTAELSADIVNYHAHDITDEPLRGWNTYLNLQTSKILKEATEWFEEYTGKRWYCIDTNDMQLIEEAGGSKYLFNFAFGTKGPTEFPPPDIMFFDDSVNKLNGLLKSSGTGVYPWSSWGYWGHENGRITSEQIGLYYRITLPLLARSANFFDWDPERLSDVEQQKWSRAFGEILSRMTYYGGYYGNEKGAINALFIGDKDIGVTLQFLTPALNVTLYGFYDTNGDFNLTKFGDFGQFDVIVWWTDGPSMWEVSDSVRERVETFVKNGGGLVVTKGWPDWVNPILGFDFTEERITPGNIDYVDYNNPILKPYTEISGYSYFWRDWKTVSYEADPGTYIVKDTNGVPWISEHTFGFGRGIFCGMPLENWFQLGEGVYGSPRESYLTLLNNAVFYAAKKENMLPVWWFSDYKTQYLPWHTQLWFTVSGKPGCPVLLWVTNNDNATSFEIHLNATFYGIDPKGWIAIDVWNWATVAKGSGTDIKINLTIPAESWKPIYIMNATSDLQALYSNIFILKRVTSPMQIVYTLQGPCKQTSWLIINSSRPIAKVLLNDRDDLPRYASITSLNASDTICGWFHDTANDLLYIKFKPASTIHIVRINLETAVPIYERYPYLIPIATIAIVSTIEVVIWINRRRMAKKEES